MGASDLEVMIDHILENKHNLEMALDVVFAYPEVQKRVILRGLESLDRIIKQGLDSADWTVETTLQAGPIDRFGGYFVAKKEWADRWRIGIEAQKANAREFIIGVQKRREGLTRIAGLKTALDASIRHGLASPWWDWYHLLEPPYADWYNKQGLISIYDGSAPEFLGNYLLRVTSLATPLIETHLSAGSGPAA
jgi:hypothetical protein